ncbi:MAG: hypothetical protein CL846_01255 [Crocinitomicaceae bacterium]|nr:hypothetical protein [Crocinitomicaceae bacterium]|tara:strand:- start:71 stop:919 length:849 start_codon:yes stop_codon:yes gene_type:complete
MEEFENNFCAGNLWVEVSNILKGSLFKNSFNLGQYYNQMVKNYNSSLTELNRFNNILINDLGEFETLLKSKSEIKNIGVDLPIYIGDIENKNKIMIIAMDPKRSGQENDEITLNSVFSIHSKKHGRETKSNDYWKFIEPLTKENLVYLTDIYKIYYEFEDNGIKKISNKDKSFIGSESVYMKMNKSILENEIRCLQPNKIITMGKAPENALKSMFGIKAGLFYKNNGIEYIFMPHISRTVTQSITTIGSLYETIGKIKGEKKLEDLGKQIKISRDLALGNHS